MNENDALQEEEEDDGGTDDDDDETCDDDVDVVDRREGTAWMMRMAFVWEEQGCVLAGVVDP